MRDLVIIGAGWAGLNAAREAAGLGLKACLIENGPLGGTCLNAGCIPAKTLVQSAKLLEKIRKAGDFGVSAGSALIDLPGVQRRKEKVISTLRKGLEGRLKGLELVREEAVPLDERRIKAGTSVIEAKNMIIASGSLPRALPGLDFDHERILSSDDMLALEKVPASLLVIGGGAIGCEFASIFRAFGSEVTVTETCPNLIPGTDRDIARKLEASFRRRGIKVMTGAEANTIDLTPYEKVLVSVGRRPRTAFAEKLGAALENGRIRVDDRLMTSVPGVYAAGDCTGRLMLAHYAEYQGRVAARNASGMNVTASLTAVPSCIFTSPEIACVGLTAEQAAAAGVRVKEFRLDFLASGMAHVMGETEGMIKIVAEEGTERVAGAFVIGPNACELGGTLTLAVQAGLAAGRLRETLFAHPSLTEAIVETLR